MRIVVRIGEVVKQYWVCTVTKPEKSFQVLVTCMHVGVCDGR